LVTMVTEPRVAALSARLKPAIPLPIIRESLVSVLGIHCWHVTLEESRRE